MNLNTRILQIAAELSILKKDCSKVSKQDLLSTIEQCQEFLVTESDKDAIFFLENFLLD